MSYNSPCGKQNSFTCDSSSLRVVNDFIIIQNWQHTYVLILMLHYVHYSCYLSTFCTKLSKSLKKACSCVCVRRIFATTKFFFALTQSQGNSDRDAHVAAYSLGRSSIKNNWLLDRCKKIVRNALWQEIGHLFKNRLQFQMKIEQTTKHSALHNSPVRHRARAGMEASRR